MTGRQRWSDFRFARRTAGDRALDWVGGLDFSHYWLTLDALFCGGSQSTKRVSTSGSTRHGRATISLFGAGTPLQIWGIVPLGTPSHRNPAAPPGVRP